MLQTAHKLKKIIKIYFILFSFAILSNCSKSPLCWGEDKNNGIIVSSIDFGICFYDFPENEYIMETEVELDSLFNLISNQDTECEKPEIDFSKHTLLGQYASGACEVKFIRDVEKDNRDESYIYTVKVRECGLCKSMAYGLNWILVPKLPNDWSVKFEIK